MSGTARKAARGVQTGLQTADDFRPQENDAFNLNLGWNYLSILKHPSLIDEDEWRLIVMVTKHNHHAHQTQFRNGLRGITPYVEFKLIHGGDLGLRDPQDRIRLTAGPSHVDNKLRETAAEMLLSELDHAPIMSDTYPTTYG